MVAITSFQSMFQTGSTAKTATTAATSSTSTAASTSATVAPTQRAADAPGAVKLEFTAGQPRTADTVRDQLRGKLDHALGGIYKDKDQRAKATEESLKTLAPQIEKAAASKDVTGVEIRMTNVEQNVGSATSIRGLGVEVGLVRDKKVSSADTTVLDYQGKSAGLTTAETAKGLTKGSYSHQGEASSTSATDAGSAALSKARSALSKVQQTTDALRAYRNGDSSQLDALRAQIQGGGSSTSQTQSTSMDPTTALMSKDANVRKAALSQMTQVYKVNYR
jgi:hypothetical protein